MKIEVTTKTIYNIPDYYLSMFNEDVKLLVKDWFKDYPLNKHHATRDYCKEEEKFVRARVIEEKDDKDAP